MKAPVSLAWHEFAHAHFGHWARTTRVMQMWERLSSHPSGTVSAVFEVPAERKGAYRFLESPKVRWEPLAEAVHVATARRCSRHALVIGIVDGSSIAHTDRRGDDGVGSVGSRRMGGRGIKSMPARRTLCAPSRRRRAVIGRGCKRSSSRFFGPKARTRGSGIRSIAKGTPATFCCAASSPARW